jgi:hypothetical protein
LDCKYFFEILDKGTASNTLKDVAKDLDFLATKSASEYKTRLEEEGAVKGNSAGFDFHP